MPPTPPPIDQPLQVGPLEWLLPILALTALSLILWRGYLKPASLADAPERRIGLIPADLLVGFGLMLAGMFASQLVVPAFVSVDAQTGRLKLEALSAVQRAGLTLVMQVVQYLPPVAYLVWRAVSVPDGLKQVGLLPRRPGRELLMGLAGTAAAVPITLSLMLLMVWLGHLVGQPAPQVSHPALERLLGAEAEAAKALIVLSAVVVAPALEEVIFRGLLQTALLAALGWGRRWSAITLAAGGFALIHAGGVAPHALLPLFAIGIILGWLYERSGSLWPSILVHAGFNLTNIVLTVVMLP